ncbi:MAG: amidohydrolase family protein [Pseudomonadota bacterium]
MSGQRTFEHLSPFSFGDCLTDPSDWFDRGIATKYGGSYDAYYSHIEDLFAALDRQTCHEVYEAMSANGTYFAPTLVMELNDRSRVPAADIAFISPDFRDWCDSVLDSIDDADSERRERVYRQFSDTLLMMKDAGVRLLAGSDMPNNCIVPGFSLHWELERLVEAGVSPLEALQAATINAAAAMDRDDEIGQLRPGFAADIVLLNANPLDQISNTRMINGIMLNGRWIDEPERAEMFNTVKARIDSMRVKEQSDQ